MLEIDGVGPKRSKMSLSPSVLALIPSLACGVAKPDSRSPKASPSEPSCMPTGRGLGGHEHLALYLGQHLQDVREPHLGSDVFIIHPTVSAMRSDASAKQAGHADWSDHILEASNGRGNFITYISLRIHIIRQLSED